MATDIGSDHDAEIKDLKHALRTANLELNLERSKHSVEIVVKDEEIRQLRVRECLLQDETGDLHEQIEEEQARADDLETALDEALVQLDEQKAAAEIAQSQIRTQSREVANLKAELRAMENVTSDSDKILSEKLALNRELSSLRPEVEHLRTQVEANAGLLSEKLALQRQLNTAQVELENEKRAAARAQAKQGKKMEQDDELRATIEELRKELAAEKKERLNMEATLAKAEKAAEKAQADLETQQQATERAQNKLETMTKKEADKASKQGEEREAELEQLQEELAREKSARVKAEKAMVKGGDLDAQLEELREELENEKRQRQKLEKASKKSSQQSEEQSDDLKNALEEERRERKKQEKEYAKALAELEGRNIVLDDKLNAFREKLRSTKEKLKAKEAALERVERAQTAPPVKARLEREGSVKPTTTNIRKRMAASVEPETNLGTPGNGFPTKKAKRGISTAPGDTSTFSLTPLLNRTGKASTSDAIIEEEEDESILAEHSKKESKKAAAETKKPLAPSASNKANAKPRKKTPMPPLEMVSEETSNLSSQLSTQSKDNSENAPAPVTVALKTTDGPSKSKSIKHKPRKSLMSFATFTEEPVVEKKKKRKLGSSSNGGGLGKTLFDAEDEDVAPARPASSKGIFAARALSKSVLGKQGKQGPISGGYNMLSEEGFSFSPLKKDRRGASILK